MPQDADARLRRAQNCYLRMKALYFRSNSFVTRYLTIRIYASYAADAGLFPLIECVKSAHGPAYLV